MTPSQLKLSEYTGDDVTHVGKSAAHSNIGIISLVPQRHSDHTGETQERADKSNQQSFNMIDKTTEAYRQNKTVVQTTKPSIGGTTRLL